MNALHFGPLPLSDPGEASLESGNLVPGLLLAGNEEGSVYVFDLSICKQLAFLESQHRFPILGCQVSLPSMICAVVSADCRLSLYSVRGLMFRHGCRGFTVEPCDPFFVSVMLSCSLRLGSVSWSVLFRALLWESSCWRREVFPLV